MARGWTADSIPDLTGRVALVTGANSGIGFETALQLAGHGARTILACRDGQRAQAALNRIQDRFPRATVETVALDLSSLASVRAAALAVQARASKLDILVNNAGFMGGPRRSTADGFEAQLGANYLGHFAFTGLLFDLLLRSRGARVVSLGSIAAWWGRLRFDDLQSLQRYNQWLAYGQSKLAALVFSQELQRRSVNRGLPIASLACHPGYAATNLQRASSRASGSRLSEWMFGTGNRLFAMSAAKGALMSLYAATSPDARGGEYIAPRGPLGLWGAPGNGRLPRRASDEVSARRLWDLSEELTSVKYEALARAA